MRILAAAALLALALGAAGCNNGSVTPVDPSTLPPDTSLLPPSRTPEETFTGSITDLSGTNFHNFTINSTSDLYIAVPLISPSVTLWLGLGSPTSQGCSLGLFKQVTASANFAYRQLSEPAGSYCIAVEDNNRVAPFSYTVQVWHQ